ncbi:hypothetical protein GCM10010361_09090 [Streptomyces olivaceiscleroticus]|uniref:Extensin n=1 Tax=Streptomyces olivaceiscleroticus TaxID=68245 RepID=A0ABN0ZGZ3_9ACTN
MPSTPATPASAPAPAPSPSSVSGSDPTSTVQRAGKGKRSARSTSRQVGGASHRGARTSRQDGGAQAPDTGGFDARELTDGQVDELTHRLIGPLTRLLRTELRMDRERIGRLRDPRR